VIHGQSGIEASAQFDKIDDAKAWLNAQAVRVAA
jgi:hypothetical protein